MSVRDAWRGSFPQQSAQLVVAYVVNLWGSLVSTPDPHFGWHLNEPDITKRFKQRLQNGADSAGISGEWMAENVSMEFDPVTRAPRKVNRTDIVYFSDRVQPTLRLTFEFKKLKDTRASRKAYYGSNGMGRFLAGTYCKTEPFGIMVSVVDAQSQRVCVDKLKSALRDEDLNSVLNYVPDEHNGAWVREPSREMVELADFDTQHHRVLAGFETFMFAHLVLTFPSAS